MKDVLIEIKGYQEYENGVKDSSSFTTSGIITYEDNLIKINYDESEMIGAAGVKSEIIIENNSRAILTRTGDVQTRMIIEQGKRHSCFYSTPQGDFTIGIFGEKFSSSFENCIVEIYMSYTIDVNSGLLSKNIMEIKVKELE